MDIQKIQIISDVKEVIKDAKAGMDYRDVDRAMEKIIKKIEKYAREKKEN